MKHSLRLAVVACCLVGSLIFLAPKAASARGGAAANIMGSPGYQRALEESRKRQAEPYLKKPAVYPRKKWQQRGRRN